MRIINSFPSVFFILMSTALLFAADTDETAFNAWKKDQKLPVYRVKTVASAPILDGKIDPLYAEIGTPLKLVFNDGYPGELNCPTTLYALCDGKALYIAAECVTGDPSRLIAARTKRDDSVWMDECVELFCNPTGKRDMKYFIIQVNAAGVIQDAKNKDDISWNADIEAKTDRTDKAWVVELKIPLADLGCVKGSTKKVWTVNFTRSARDMDDPDIAEDQAWSPTKTSTSHIPDMFGTLWLDAGDVLP